VLDVEQVAHAQGGTQILVVLWVSHSPDVFRYMFQKNRTWMTSSSESGFKAMNWSIKTEVLLVPRSGRSSRYAVF